MSKGNRDGVNKVMAGMVFFLLVLSTCFLPSKGTKDFAHAAMLQTEVTGNGPFVLVNFFEGTGPPIGTCNTSYNYGILYWDHTNGNIWVCAANGWALANNTGGGGGGGAIPTENNVAYTSTPTFSSSATINAIVLSGPVSSSTIGAALEGGVCTTFIIKQNGGPYSFVWPSNMKGGMPNMTGRSAQQFCYYASDGVWLANTPGVTNE
jgi:hypothetical protein